MPGCNDFDSHSTSGSATHTIPRPKTHSACSEHPAREKFSPGKRLHEKGSTFALENKSGIVWRSLNGQPRGDVERGGAADAAQISSERFDPGGLRFRR
ncbi:hypothetical protein JTE90_025365 [Oedothorax gibbosus]|uniref:Uncharacterized protein n=1 Tax=Oedothorax gibbosus TaxID=931172 RepID=A0AAV6U8S8_9ARAC|nr:hypothetical protein JTE90_025365 [Oedothorax gibbosus]